MYSVLYVDDEPSLLEIGQQFLERSGEFRIDTSLSAMEAMEKIEVNLYDAIVSDYQMPGTNGIEFLKQVRALGNPIPFIIFTGRGREEVVIQALNEGADFYIQKGGDPKSQFIELEYKIRLAIERRQTADELSESRQRMRDIIDHLPDATVAIDLEGMVIAWNQAMEEMTGVPKEQILATRDHSYGLPFYGKKRPILLDLVLKENKEIEATYAHIARKGSKLISETYVPLLYGGKGAYLWFIASPLYDRHGGITGAIESIRDITDLKRAEADLVESEERYRNVIEDQTEFICRFLPDGTHIFVNEAYCRYFGLDREEIIGTRFHPKIHPEDLEMMAGLIASLTVDNPLMTIDQRIIMQDGSTRWQRWVDRAIFNADGSLKEYQSVGRDITETKRIEEVLRSTQEKFTKAFLASPDAIMISDLKSGKFVEINNATSQIFGYSRDEMIGKSALDLGIWVRKEDRDAFISHVKKHGLAERYDIVNRHKSGKLFNASVSADVITLDGRKHLISVVRDITGRKQIEEALRESLQKYRNIVETTPDIIWEIDKSGNFTYVSPQTEKIFGYLPSDLVGKPIFSFIYEDDTSLIRDRLTRHEKGNEWLSKFEVRARHRDGRCITIEIHSTPFISPEGILIGFRGICHDITPRKRTEEALRNSNATLERAEELGRSGSWEFHFNENEVHASKGARILYGLTGSRWTIDEVQKIPLPACRPLLNTALSDLIAGKAPYNVEFKIRRKSDGAVLDIHSVAEYDPVRNVVIGVVHDITGKNLGEDLTRTALHRMDTLISRLNAGIMMVSESGRVERVNQALCNIFNLPDSPESLYGLKSDEMINKVLDAYLFPEETIARIHELTTRGKPVLGYEIPLRNGRIVMVDYIPLFDENGRPCGRVWHHQDITDRVRALDALYLNERRLASIYDTVSDVIFQLTVEPDGMFRFSSVNPAFCSVTGLTHDAVVGKTVNEVIPEPSLCLAMEKYAKAIAERKIVRWEETTDYPTGRLTGEVSITPVFDNAGNCTHLVGSVHDITDRKRGEDAMRQANRQLDLMTSVTRHDINNKISVIRGYLEIIKRKLSDPVLEDYCKKMESAVSEIRTQIEFTRIYHDLGTHEPRWEDLDQMVQALQVPPSVALHVNVTGVTVYANPMLEKVFSNLLDNSVRHGRHVSEIRVHWKKTKKGLTVYWEDNGIGIPGDQKERIFERGFGTNTGLGLFLVREILALTDISIKETGTENKGSRFEIEVPRGAYRIADEPGRILKTLYRAKIHR
ncbi:MAG TPA: PAS domain S-box protein [Methanoregulaceae archaeon]|nr:PAS domain S-box protein [Methanoregulaceae archaeon]